MIVHAYISYLGISIPEEREKADDHLMAFLQKNIQLPPETRELNILADEDEWATSPLADRPVGEEFLAKITPPEIRHTIVGKLSDLFTHASLAIDALGMIARRVQHIWIVDPFLHIQEGDNVEKLLTSLRALDCGILSLEHARRKALSKARRRGLKRPAGLRPLYGYQIIKGKDGQSFLVEDEAEREVLKWILEARDSRRLTWDEIHQEAKQLRIKNRQGGPLSLKGIMRRHAAAEKLFAPDATPTA